MENGAMVAAVLMAVVGIILIFTILKINENLDNLNKKLDHTNETLDEIKRKLK